MESSTLPWMKICDVIHHNYAIWLWSADGQIFSIAVRSFRFFICGSNHRNSHLGIGGAVGITAQRESAIVFLSSQHGRKPFSSNIFSSKAPLSQENTPAPQCFQVGSLCVYGFLFYFPFLYWNIHSAWLCRCLIIHVRCLFGGLWPTYLFSSSFSLLCFSECLCIKWRACRLTEFSPLNFRVTLI